MARRKFGQLTDNQAKGRETPQNDAERAGIVAYNIETVMDAQKRWNALFRALLQSAMKEPTSELSMTGTLRVQMGPVPLFHIDLDHALAFATWTELLEDLS